MKTVRRWLEDERGAVATVVGVLLPVMLGFGALGVDLTRLYATEERVQNGADAVAMAGAVMLTRGVATGVIPERAEAYAESVPSGAIDVAVGCWNPGADPKFRVQGEGSCDSGSVNAVRAVGAQTVNMALAGALGVEGTTASGQAVAGRGKGNAGCVFALRENGVGVAAKGTPTLDAQGCDIVSNSTPTSVSANSKAVDIKARSLLTSGGIDDKHNSIETCDERIGSDCALKPMTDTGEVYKDPYNDLKLPDSGDADHLHKNKVTWDDSVSLPSGTHLFENGLKIKGSADVTGHDVTLAFDGGSIQISGDPSIDLDAPEPDPDAPEPEGDDTDYPGVVMFGQGLSKGSSSSSKSKDDSGNGPVDLTGASSLELTGVVYFPDNVVDFGGTADSTDPNHKVGECLKLIAHGVRLHGTPGFKTDCQAQGTRDIVSAGYAIMLQ